MDRADDVDEEAGRRVRRAAVDARERHDGGRPLAGPDTGEPRAGDREQREERDGDQGQLRAREGDHAPSVARKWSRDCGVLVPEV
jgi:hypothetical protein